MPSLSEIIRADAAYMKNVTVEVNRRLPTVGIKDDSGRQQSVFMQGDDADSFIFAFDALTEQAPDVNFEDIELHLAKPYVDCIWN